MLFKEKKQEEKIKNPYPWPKCYYMEGETEERERMLNERLLESDGEEIQKIKRLFDLRYRKIKGQKYADNFMKAWLELLLLGQGLRSPLSERKNKKTAEKISQILCLDKEEELGRDVLYDELCHLAGVYIISCQNDSKYQAVLFDFGRMKESKVKDKIRGDLKLVSCTVPQALQMEDTFSLFRKAVAEMEERLL